MITDKLYNQNAYLKEFQATVLDARRDDLTKGALVLTLDRTCFFPEAGGQQSDKGVLRLTDKDGRETTLSVVDAQMKDGAIAHYVGDTDGLADALDLSALQGARVTGEIDFARRYDFMQQHTGEHIVSGAVHKAYGYDNVGFRLSENTVTMDYNGVLTPEQILEIERKANEAVRANHTVTVSFPSEEEQKTLVYRSKKEIVGEPLRIVTIPDADVCACCAPHVKATGEIGLIKIIRLQNWKGGVRLSIVCGARATELFALEHDMITRIARDLSTSPENIPDRFERMRAEIGALKKELAPYRKAAKQAEKQAAQG